MITARNNGIKSNVTRQSSMNIDIVELEKELYGLEQLHERCEQQLFRPSEIRAFLADIDRKVRGLIPPGSDLFRLYDRCMREGTDWWRETLSGYVDKADCKNVGRRIALLREILSKIEPEFLRSERLGRTQIYFQEGEVYRARQEFYRLLKLATHCIDIIDPYLDPDVLDFVDAIDITISFRLLTGTPKPLFVQQLSAFQGAGRSVETRSNTALSHDRFLIIDGQECWHLGTSINGLGKKACMINKVVDAAELAKLILDFQTWWSTGLVL